MFAATPPWDGTLQKYYIVAGDYCYPLPAHLNAEDGALCEPVAVAVQICKVAELKGGQTVLVLGCGPIGVLCQAVAKAYGASKVIGVDLSKSRCEFAKDFAADGVHLVEKSSNEGVDPVDASRALGEKIVKEFGLGEGADVVLECTGAEPCIQAGIFAARKGGTYVQAGMGKEVSLATKKLNGSCTNQRLHYTECCLPNHYSLYPSPQYQGLDQIQHWLLPRSCCAYWQWKNQPEQTHYAQVPV